MLSCSIASRAKLETAHTWVTMKLRELCDAILLGLAAANMFPISNLHKKPFYDGILNNQTFLIALGFNSTVVFTFNSLFTEDVLFKLTDLSSSSHTGMFTINRKLNKNN